MRIENEILEKIGRTAGKRHLDRSTFLRQLIMRAYKEETLDLAIEEYQKGTISLEKIADKTELTVWEVMDELKRRNIQANVALEDMEGTHLL